MTRSPRRFGAVAAPALAIVLALTVSSCSTSQAGAAATVGNRRISVSDVQNAYQDIVPLVGQDQQITQVQILNLLILAPYLTQAAAAAGRGVSDQDAREDIHGTGVAASTKLSNSGLEVWRANLAATALQNGAAATPQLAATYQNIGVQLKKAGVHINPRYGSKFDYTDFSIAPETPDWLVTKAPVATATPAPAPTDAPAPGATPDPGATPTP